MEVNKALLNNLPYIDMSVVRGEDRVVPIGLYYDVEKSSFIHPLFYNNEFREQRVENLITGFYYATKPADETRDVPLLILNTTKKYYYSKRIGSPAVALMQDFVALCGIIELYYLLCEKYSDSPNANAFFLIRNLIEYLLYVVRSSFDLMQIITKWIVSANTDLKLLPDSFNKMFKANGDLKPDKLAKTPEKVVSFYHQSYPFFADCKDLRDEISHRGCELSPIFDFKGDFGVFIKRGDKDTVFSPFEKFGIWPVEERKANNIGSVLSFVVFTINELINLSGILSGCLLDSFPVTSVIKTEYYVYFRGGYTHYLLNLESLKNRPWLNN